jgi:hypothetical protein
VRDRRAEHAYGVAVQSPSSLIFLVLLGVWAAYFVQYWIRRRDHLATARSVEQFSAAMRVLERRATIPRTDLSDPAPRSWSVHPARSARPQVVVKRAVPAEVGSPRTVSVPVERPTARPVPVRSGAARRARGLVLLTSLVALVVTGVLAAVSVVVPWAPAVAFGALVLAFAWVRAGVRADRSAAAARRRRAREEARRRASAPAAPSVRRPVARPAATTVSSGAVVEEPSVASEAAVAQAVAAEPVAVQPAEPVETVEVVAEAAPVAPEPEPVIEYVHLVDEDDIPLTWDPVPVPRPTYTMKAKAERPEVAPAAVTPDPVPVEGLRARADELDERRVAGA